MKIKKHGIQFSDYKELSLVTPKAHKVSPPSSVKIPLKQHEGLPALPSVHEGDYVLAGSLIATAQGDFSANVHSSVSGEVAQVSPDFISVHSDGTDAWDRSIEERKNWRQASAEEILHLIRLAGIVSLGETALPLDLKLRDCEHAGETLILNGCESEPFLTSDHVLMLQHAAEILHGAQMLLKASGKEKCVIAVENNKLEAIEILLSKIRALQMENVEVKKLLVRYPQGFEAILARTLLGFRVVNGHAPFVESVAAAYAVYEAVRFGKPFVERIVTVTGHCVAEPKNFVARIGTSAFDLIKNCKGLLRDPACVLFGGPMSGTTLTHLESPVTKHVSGIVALAKEYVHRSGEQPCTRCGLCADVCPEGLVPEILIRGVRKQRTILFDEFRLSECVECGNCTFICPSKIPLAELLRKGKRMLAAQAADVLRGSNEEALWL